MEKDFLGRGWAFPPQFTKSARHGGEVAMVEGAEDIEQSLAILLRTSVGERVMRPDFGCNLGDFQFESLSSAAIGRLKDMVINAILYHEPRIDLERLEVRADGPDLMDGRLVFDIDYSVRTTNNRFNFVWNYYRNEAAAAAF